LGELVAIGFLAGIIAGISPCILPVLPVVLVAGATTPVGASRRRPLLVVAGLVVTFSFVVLAGSEVLSALGLPQDLLRDAGIALLIVIGVSFLVRPLGELLERPFSRIASRQPSGSAGGFVLGLGLGLVFAPCAGPILAAITVVGATHRVGLTAVFLTIAFGAGAAVPLLVVAIAGNELTRRAGALRRQAPKLRVVGGVVLVAMAVAIAANAFDTLQRDVPGYTNALQNHVEGSAKVRSELGKITGEAKDSTASLSSCRSGTSSLVQCGAAPNFTGITAWLNTPGGKPLSLANLRGKVVLVDFWTYSCINCQRALPHVEAWYSRYKKYGLEVVGVETPEFSFEHIVSNVRTAAAQLGVRYPVAVDDNYATWDAYDNEYWPADYLIDAQGDVRHESFGEGGYSTTERLIRKLLKETNPHIALPPLTSVANKTPTGELSPETYVGYDRLQYLDPAQDVTENAPALYHAPSSVQLGELAFSGTWTERAEEATAGPDAGIELGFLANDVYLVLGGTGTIDVSVDGHPTRVIDVRGIPDLYTLFHSFAEIQGTLSLRVSPGVEAYDFTFG
jgi:cytochrome c biogenesis protein CcdA/thiol-disulfide isomerase/thioredoxin